MATCNQCSREWNADRSGYLLEVTRAAPHPNVVTHVCSEQCLRRWLDDRRAREPAKEE